MAVYDERIDACLISMRRDLLVLCASTLTLVSAHADELKLPEAATGFSHKAGWLHKREAVAAANPLAAEAGAAILRAGGSAVDAAVAVQAVLGLVEPQSSGIGGGAVLMTWDGRAVHAYDGRETAPAAATEDMLLGSDGKPLSRTELAGRAVAVPGAIPMLELAHRAEGRLPWALLFEPAIRLAEQGFAVSPRLAALIAGDKVLLTDAQARAYFFDAEGKPLSAGARLKNPAYAAVLRRIAADGARVLQQGPIAADIVRRVRAQQGVVTEADLAGYKPLVRAPLCNDWSAYRLCGFPPPSSGHLTLMQTLRLLEIKDALKPKLELGAPDAAWLHRFTEAANLAFADRGQYIADPAFVVAPGGDWNNLLDPGYLMARAALMDGKTPGTTRIAEPGRPPGLRVSYAPQPDQPEHGTSHISIIDAAGRAVAMTTTVEAGFGARIMSDGGTGLAGGFLLNNEMTDFARAPRDAKGLAVANRVEPGKRPRSSMAPTLVFDGRNGTLLMSLGSPGGPVIIPFVTKTLLGSLAWGLSVQEAIALPNFASFNTGTIYLEAERWPPGMDKSLRELGDKVEVTDLNSGIQGIRRLPDGSLQGGADPRREGVVAGR
ncbi:MAG TPA: gamma-glutamyltransferase family protein [Burkholderiaceae bacterium]